MAIPIYKGRLLSIVTILTVIMTFAVVCCSHMRRNEWLRCAYQAVRSSSLFRRLMSLKILLLFEGITFAHYDSKFRSHRQLCLSILKEFGFGQSVMEARILVEVEEMINKVREEQGRPFDMRQLTSSCVANVIMNMLFGHRFDHSDPAFQQLISDIHHMVSDAPFAVLMFPPLRFLPFFKTKIAQHATSTQNVLSFMKKNIATCIEVCIFVISFTTRYRTYLMQHNTIINSLCRAKIFAD